MSVFIIPVQDNYQRRPTYSRCGPSYGSQSSWNVHPFHRRTAIPRSPFSTLFDVAEDDTQDTLMSFSSSPWEQHFAQLRRQEYLEDVQRRQRLIARQQQLEREQKERELIRRERERLARLAWEEHQRRGPIEYQRRVEAYKKQQEEAYAQRIKLAKQRQAEWDQFASHALVGVMDFVEQLFGGEDTSSQKEEKKEATPSQPVVTTSRAEEKKPEKQADPEKVEVATEKMQVDEPQASTTTAAEAETNAETKEDVKEPVQTVEPTGTETNEVTEAKEQQLVFTYPLPQDESIRATIKADDINVTYDAASKTINLTGLWSDSNNDSSSSSTAKSGDESRGRKRSRSPKRPRVSEVDEKTGEEIIQPEEVEEEEYVEVNPAPKTVSKSIRLPEGAKVDNLRAEITDEGFKVWI